MKKFKKITTSLLCLLMSGSMLFAVGCDDDNSGAESSSGKNPVTAETTATQADKTAVLNSFTSFAASFETKPEQIIKLTLDLDMLVTSMSESSGSSAAGGGTTTTTKSVSGGEYDATAYLQLNGMENIFMDAWLEGVIKDDGETSYGYADVYIRGNDLYAGATDSLPAKPTDTDKAAIKYQKENLSVIWQELMESLGIGMGEAAPEEGDVATVSTTNETEAGGIEKMQTLIVKAAENVFNGLTATVKSEGNVKTLTLDFKKEMDLLVNTVEVLGNSIQEGTTLKQMLESKELENLFNKYLGTITAEEIRDVMMLYLVKPETDPNGGTLQNADSQDTFPLPEAGQSGYQYLVKTICAMNAGSEEDPDKTMGDQVFTADDKAEMLEMIGEAKKALEQINSLKFAIRTTDNVFSGIAVDIDIKDSVDMYLSISMETVVSYNFKEVSGLNVEQPAEEK